MNVQEIPILDKAEKKDMQIFSGKLRAILKEGRPALQRMAESIRSRAERRCEVCGAATRRDGSCKLSCES